MPILNWIGKDKVINHHLDVPYRILDKKYTHNATSSENKIIHGDNLEALKSLLPEYEGRINCIYIDPPYNTGKEEWLYSDNVSDPKIQRWLERVVGKEGEDLARDDKWLCMMYPRLKLLYQLLHKTNGVIFISIDDYEHANLKLICDEIFGASNFINNIIWQRAYSPVNTKKRFSANHDFILCYAKNKEMVEFSLKRTDEADSRYGNPDNDYRGVWTSGDLSVGPAIEEKIYEITTPNGRKVMPPKGYCWRLTKERFKEFLTDNRIWFGEDGGNVPRIKRFKSEVKDGITPMTVWTYNEVGHTQDAKKEVKAIFPETANPFDTPKSLRLIDRILQLGTDENSIILDSFAGSATTAHAVLNLNKEDGGNRRFILIEMEDYANDITAERVKRVIAGYGDGKKKVEGTEGDFSFYELGQPLFLENEYLNEELPLIEIHRYIWYTETASKFDEQKKEHKHLLGIYDNSSYYFFYEKDSLTTLSYEFLDTIKHKSEAYVIYADNCVLPKEFMAKQNIIFKKIPRDITRF